jgi:hypothetical protein
MIKYVIAEINNNQSIWGPDTLISLSFFFFDKPEIIFGN